MSTNINTSIEQIKSAIPDLEIVDFDHYKKQSTNIKPNEMLAELYNAFYDIPFDNSAFQTEMFVLAAQITPERAYRSIGIRLLNRINDIDDQLAGFELEKYHIEELVETMNNTEFSKLERKKAEIALRQMAKRQPFTIKLLNDAITEIELLYTEFKKYPKYTRAEFEAGEFRHYLERSKRQSLGIDGGRDNLVHMLHDYKNLESFKEKVQSLSQEQRALLEQITEEIIGSVCTPDSNVLSMSLVK
jgi:hypothetical protein